MGSEAQTIGKPHGYWVCGGETGIRTPDRLLTYTRFPGVRLKPLIHLSGAAVGEGRQKTRGASIANALCPAAEFPFALTSPS